MRRLLRVRRRDESGIVAVVVALVTCFTLLPLAAFAVDIGVQRVARRDMQAVADMVALDLARDLDGRSYAQLYPGLQARADRSAARNHHAGDPAVISAELGTVDPAAYDPLDQDAHFTPITSDAGGVPNAVRVTATTSVAFSLAGGRGGASRSAIAQAGTACFKLGSYALGLNSASSPLLNALIGGALGVGVLGYTGLANANVSLLGLAAELGAGTTQELVDLDNLSLGDLYLAAARVLAEEGGDTADITLLNQLASLNIGSLPRIAFGDLISLQPGADAALDTSVNLLDLVATSAFVANGENALAIPNLTVGVPGIASVTGSLKIIQSPQQACGRVNQAVASTSQVKLEVALTLAPVNVLNILLLGLVSAETKVVLNVDLAKAVGTLRRIQCGPGNPEGIDVEVASALSEIGLSVPTTVRLFGLPIASITGGVGTTAAPVTGTAQIRVPPGRWDQAVSTGTGTILPGLNLSSLQGSLLGSPGIDLGLILGGLMDLVITPIVNPLLANINNLLLRPLTDLLGIQLAGADVFGVPHPRCDDVSLAG